jgi:hypothetical protein
MLTFSALALVADTLLVRPVDVPAPWYSVATGILSIIVTLLLLGIAVALLGMARALKGAEKNLGGRMQGLADELIPLARNLNQIALKLSDVTGEARTEIKRISGTITVVDEAVRDAIDASEERLARFGALLDVVQDEAQATVASATGLLRGVRTGAGSMVSSLFGRNGTSRPRATVQRAKRAGNAALDESDVRARLAALEAALADLDGADDDDTDEDDVIPRATSRDPLAAPGDGTDEADEWDDEDDVIDDESESDADDNEDDDDLDDDLDDDDLDDEDDDEDDDDIDFDDAPDDSEAERQPEDPDPVRSERSANEPRRGGPRIRTRRQA